MSYHCNCCGNVHEGSELKIITKVRPIKYKRYGLRTENTREKEKTKVYNGNYEGWEIAKEEKVCSTCYEEKKDIEPVRDTVKDVEYFGRKKLTRVEDDFYTAYAEYIEREIRSNQIRN